MNKEDFIQFIEKMTVTELNDLVKALEEKFGVSAASFATAGAAGAGNAEAVEEKDSFTIVLKDAGSAKIQVIKVQL
ncbi:MAG: 50S ribosomal protein L7/L12 [Parcubacteria group bacterium GW2011_GWC1_39_29]|nr:MAG: 50S ribosomal protein L7/L12 [Parcubacteria group bacterium GW2011_GWC1_39_29]